MNSSYLLSEKLFQLRHCLLCNVFCQESKVNALELQESRLKNHLLLNASA